MPIDESLYDQARRYAVALLAEGRTRLRDQEPSVPGALVAEVFWHIESILPHLSRCQLESLILETDKNGANWRKYTVARARTGQEALRWGRWAATRKQMARQEVAADRRAKELRSSVSGNELLEMVAIQPARPATANDREVLSSEIDAPIRSGWIPRKTFFTTEGLLFSAIGYSPAGWLCNDSDGSCLSDRDCCHPMHRMTNRTDHPCLLFACLKCSSRLTSCLLSKIDNAARAMLAVLRACSIDIDPRCGRNCGLLRLGRPAIELCAGSSFWASNCNMSERLSSWRSMNVSEPFSAFFQSSKWWLFSRT